MHWQDSGWNGSVYRIAVDRCLLSINEQNQWLLVFVKTNCVCSSFGMCTGIVSWLIQCSCISWKHHIYTYIRLSMQHCNEVWHTIKGDFKCVAYNCSHWAFECSYMINIIAALSVITILVEWTLVKWSFSMKLNQPICKSIFLSILPFSHVWVMS